MSITVERLRSYATEDHDRGCHGREYSCSCGYDDQRDPLLVGAADEIARLRAALRDIIQDSFSVYAIDVARAALEGKE